MYEISVEKDIRTVILFLDYETFIPDTYEDCGPVVEVQQKTFVIRFNKHYAPLAEKIKYTGRDVIAVKALYDEAKMGEEISNQPVVIKKEEIKDMIYSLVKDWQTIFHLSNTEIRKFWYEMKKRYKIIK